MWDIKGSIYHRHMVSIMLKNTKTHTICGFTYAYFGCTENVWKEIQSNESLYSGRGRFRGDQRVF